MLPARVYALYTPPPLALLATVYSSTLRVKGKGKSLEACGTRNLQIQYSPLPFITLVP